MDYRRNLYLRCSIIIVLSGGTACGSSADIVLRDQTIVSGTIVSSDKEAVYIDAPRGENAISRDRIQDIDHPGNGAGTVGVLLTVYGILNIWVGASKCDEKGSAFCVGVFTPATVGVSLMAWGFATYAKSVSASHASHANSDYALSHLLVSPIYISDGKSGSPGLMLARSF
jgi:hypothetical protein